MVTLGIAHYAYILLILVIIAIMAMRKDVVIPCIIGLLIMGFIYKGSIVGAIQVIFNSLIVSGNEFWGIILIISLIVAMSTSLKEFGVDSIILQPIKKLMIGKNTSFFVLGIVMCLISLVIWPSPSVALVGAIVMPAAIAAGLSPIWAAVSMNIFGHGIALSSDYFIQGAPKITAGAAGLDTSAVIASSLPLWSVMSIVTVATAFYMMKRDEKTEKTNNTKDKTESKEEVKYSKGAYFISILTVFAFICDLVLMVIYDLKGGDATALVGGTVLIIMVICTITQHGLSEAYEKATDNVRTGFNFGIKIFAPILVIGAFFFMGGEGTAKVIFGENATGIFNDLGLALSQTVPLTKIPIILVQSLIAFVVGLDGSGFSGLPLVGSLSATFAEAANINQAGLAALGQIITICVGGGTLIPWAVIPVAAICNVSPVELAKKNMIPVLSGIGAMIIVAMFIL